MIRTIPRDLDRGLSWWGRLGPASVVGSQLLAAAPGAAVLVAVYAARPTSSAVLAACAAAWLGLDLAGQGAAGTWLGRRADAPGAAEAPTSLARGAVRFVAAALAALLPLAGASAALTASVLAALPPALVAGAGAAVLAAAAWSLVGLGRAALRTVGGESSVHRARRRVVGAQAAAQLSLFAVAGALAAGLVGFGGFVAPGGELDPSAALSRATVQRLVRAQVAQLGVARALWMFTAAWAWCTWIAVALEAAPAGEGGRWRSSSPTEP